MIVDPISGLGMILGLLAWLRGETGGRDILQHLNSQDVIGKYLEWLRRKDQLQLISEINSCKTDLLSQLAEIGPQLSALAGQIYSVADDLTIRLDDLNAKISPPALYSIPLETRASAPISIRCRDKEIEFLCAVKSDALVVGQPGTGKTFLLTEFARKANAKFLLTSDPDVAVAAVTAACPEIVIVDDAWARLEVVKRLCHARMMHNLHFRIVAVCWPFEKDDIQLTLQIRPDNVLELEELPRKEIAAIVKEVAAIRKMLPNDAFIRIAVQQARGRPGLAVSLTLATIESLGEGLLSGDILLRDLGSFMQRYVSSDARILLAASLQGLWRTAVVESLTEMLTSDAHERDLYLHNLPIILKNDPSIAFEVLRDVLPQTTHLLMRSDRHLHELVDCLTYEQRKILLPFCKGLFHSDLPAILVGGDLSLYTYLLANAELQRYHLNLLAGDPTSVNWGTFAKAALQKGYKHAEVMYATQGDGFSWSGEMSGYYQQWVDRFEKLKKSDDPDMQQIGDEGLKWAIPNRDACRRGEKKEQIFG